MKSLVVRAFGAVPAASVWAAAACGAAAFSGCALVAASPGPDAFSPTEDAVFTATRQVTSLVVEADGTLWAGTTGGVLRRRPDGAWRKWTRRDGLPSHETRVAIQNGCVMVATPRGVAAWRGEQWLLKSRDAQVWNQHKTQAMWRGELALARIDGLSLGHGKAARLVALPASSGTHISALLVPRMKDIATSKAASAPDASAKTVRDAKLWAALFGDGLWELSDKGAWQHLDIGLPAEAREITALAADAKHGLLWVGTRRAGVWRGELKTRQWTQFLQSDEPFDHNVQSLALFRGELMMSTLEDGLTMRGGAGWHHLSSAERAGALRAGRNAEEESPNSTLHAARPALSLSSVAPRQMVEFGGKLLLRHGNGKVDRFDGETWTRDVWARLPRPQVFSLAADRDRVYIGKWGGWSEWDGAQWTHFLRLPELQGLVVVALCADGDTLWIGTQSRGLAEYSHKTGALRWHDERHGLPDDWITCLQKVGDTLYAGTFVGGLARLDPAKGNEAGARWTTASELQGENVTALEVDGKGGLYAATRNGVWHQAASGAPIKMNEQATWLDSEVQALCATPRGLWIGARTGLSFVRMKDESK